MIEKISNKKPVIMLSIETKARELPGKVLLASFFAEKGFNVILTNYRKVYFALKTGAWLYIDRNSFAPRMSFFGRLKFFGFRLICIDEEGIIWLTPEDYKKRIHPQSYRFIDKYFTWGPRQTALIKEVNSNIDTAETGNPRVDLLRPELTDIYKSRADKIKDKHGDFILFVSNFSTNNSFYNNNTGEPLIDLLVKEMYRHGLMDTEEEEKKYIEYYENRERVFRKVIELMKKISIRFPNLNIIVRPHPSENHETWKTLLKDYPNVKIIYEGELTPWIIAAKSVIHNSCTTGVEAALLNIKAIAYVPIDEPQFEMELPNSVSAAAATEDEVISLIEQSPLAQSVPPVLNEYITSITGNFACSNIADEVENFYNKRTQQEIRKRKFHSSYNPISLIMLFLLTGYLEAVKFLKNWKNSKAPGQLKEYKKQKLEKITADECVEFLTKYKNLLKRFDNIRIEDKKGYIEIFKAD